MSVVENRLVFDCHQVGEAASEFMDWVADNSLPLGAERVSLCMSCMKAVPQQNALPCPPISLRASPSSDPLAAVRRASSCPWSGAAGAAG